MNIHMIGNAHVDPAWMWMIGEGMEAFISTCRAALERMQETEEFIFTCSSAAHYDFLLEAEPALFERIKEAVAAGKWSVVGGWWVEADCNLPSGESFVRQALLAQRLFIQHFGAPCSVGFCVDSFGHNANLPQLLKRAGMESYVFMRPEEHELHLDDDLFRWQAPSGDEVIAYRIPLHYSNHAMQADEKIAALSVRNNFRKHSWMLFYGVGNHGGGPTKKEIATIITASAKDDQIGFGSSEEFFKSVDAASLTAVDHELQHHAIGCYSAHSEIKRLNRKAEHALLGAERMSVLAERYCGLQPTADFARAWQNVCFGQFHDLIGGVAIAEAMEETVSMYREALAIGERATRLAVQRIASSLDANCEDGETLFVMNPTAFTRNEIVEVELWHPAASERGEILEALEVYDMEGERILSQKVKPSARIGEDRVKFIFNVIVPGFGISKYKLVRSLVKSKAHQVTQPSPIETSAIILNDATDTWSHGASAYTEVAGVMKLKSRVVVERGPIRSCVRCEYEWGVSTLIEEKAESVTGELDVTLHINWQEERKILKYRIPHQAKLPRAFYEIPYSVIERPVGEKEYPGQSWVFVQEDDSGEGIGVINDSKYSYSIDETHINILLARSAIYAHHVPPDEMFPAGSERYLDQGEQTIRLRVVHAANWQSARMPERTMQFLEPLIVHAESAHTGLSHVRESNSLSATNVQLTVLKQAEKGDGYIVRLVETDGMAANCDVLLPIVGAAFSSVFSKFEIKSFHVAKSGRVTEVNLIEL